jgi:DNA phosphorothioation-associated putative methyltransferase
MVHGICNTRSGAWEFNNLERMIIPPHSADDVEVLRHRTAIKRATLSRPTQLAVSEGLISQDTDVFDYGCGYGDDVDALRRMGIPATGWDPAHRPATPRQPASVVNLGYVVNVIEDKAERTEALRSAWDLTKRLLIVSARLVNEIKEELPAAYRDGHLTKTKTFQKYYEQIELRQWVEEVLEEQPVAAAPGVFYVFRDLDWKETFLASRIRRKPTVERISTTMARFSAQREILQPLIEFLEQRGRLPDRHEAGGFAGVIDAFDSFKKAYRLIARVTGEDQWETAKDERTQDLMVYLALSRFGGRPRRKQLPPDLTADIRAFFGTYRNACAASDELLFRAGKRDALDEAFRASPVGKKTQSALYVHRRALPNLPSVLRVLEGCARTLVGEVEGANVVKLHREIPQVSYLGYPDFDSDPHPALAGSLLVHLQTFRVSYRDYSASDNPPILHRKEEFIMANDPDHTKFAALTADEEQRGLYDDPQSIGTLQSWRETLARRDVRIVGHTVERL